jgi:hypothetical protein
MKNNRRALVLSACGITVATWSKPVIQSVILPVHAQTSAPFTCVPSVSPNLIVNPGCDGATPTGWTMVDSMLWECDLMLQDGVGAHSPPDHFFAGANTPQPTELRQDVDVSSFSRAIDQGCVSTDFEGWVRSWVQPNDEPNDESQIILEFLDGSGAVLDSFDSGSAAHPGDWVMIADSRPAPVGLRTVRIRLISRTNSGNDNDGYYDSLSLVLTTS